MNTTTHPTARFAPGTTVTLKDSGIQAKVIGSITASPGGAVTYLVDYPHGNGTMRRSVTEDALQ